ncbi:MAG: pyridoxal phosphate-dependent aminotransferase [Desulfovibrio sp.]|jgi:aspartate aminotransferase|nr:pyridoxal phosphate-dependent aminotransferase [Desulfovibrio sp.]
MKISESISALKPSATLAASAKAAELKSRGRDIISLSAGEPDFPTPDYICQAAKRAIDEGFTRYTPAQGMPEARAAAASYFNHFYDAGATAENIIISNGGKHSIYNIFLSLLNPGDQAIVPAPYWVSYPPMIELTGAKAVIAQTSPEKDFKVTPALLENCLTPKTRLLVLNSPSNPTGICYAEEELDALAQWAVDKKIIVLADEIYDRLVYAPAKPVSLCSWWKKYPENFIIVNGVSKTFAMTGWRVGYALAEPGLIRAMARLQGQCTTSVSSISQKAAIAALGGDYAEVEKMRLAFERRRDLAVKIISAWPDALCPKPQGSFYCFIDLHRHYGGRFADSTALCDVLLEKAGVAAVPGAAFGDDRCIRVSYAVSDIVLEEGLNRIAQVLFA